METRPNAVRRHRALIVVLLMVAAALLPRQALGSATGGALDGSFGVEGIVSPGFTGDGGVFDLAVQSDDKLVAVGQTQGATGSRLTVARFNPDGNLDTGFGVDGVFRLGTPLCPVDHRGTAVVIQPDGKVVVGGGPAAGTCSYDWLIARFTPDGQLDPSFDGDGVVTIDGAHGPLEGLAVSEDELGPRVVAVGSAYAQELLPELLVGYALPLYTGLDFAVVRLLDNGLADPTFGVGGRVLTDVGVFIGPGAAARTRDRAHDVLVQPDGSIVVGGRAFRPQYNPGWGEWFGSTYAAVARYLPNGALDPAFGHHGVITSGVSFGAMRHGVGDVTVDEAGRIVTAAEGPGVMLVSRYLQDGANDASFGTSGTALVPVPPWWSHDQVAGPHRAHVTADSVVVAGPAEHDFAVSRLTLDGKLDGTFGDGGVVITDLGGEEYSHGVAVQSTGRIVVGGATDRSWVLTGHLPGPAPDAAPDTAIEWPPPASSSTLTGSATSISGTASDDIGVVGVDVAIRDDVGRYWDGTAFSSADPVWNAAAVGQGTTSRSWSYHWPLPDADYRDFMVEARAVDTAATADPTPGTRTVRVDTLGPTGDVVIDGGAAAASSHAVTLTLTATDGWGVSGMRIANDAPPSGPYEPFSTTTEWTLTDGDGEKTVYAQFRDNASNESAVVSATIVVDTQAPDTQVVSGPPAITNSTTSDFEFSSTEADAAFRCRLDGDAWHPCASPVSYSGLSEGQHVFEVASVDEAGNADESPASATWSIDATPPSAPVLISPSDGAHTSDQTPVFDWSDSTDSTSIVYWFMMDDNADFSSPVVLVDGLVTSSLELTTRLKKRTYYWRVLATDAGGNESPWSNSFSLVVTATKQR